MSRLRALPASLVGEPFTTAHALKVGVTSRRLRGTDLERPFHAVRAPLTARVERCRAYQLAMAPRAAFSHATAAQLWGLPIPRYLAGDQRVHVTVPTGSAPPYGRGVAGHELGAALVRSRDVVRMEPVTHQGYALRVLDPAIVWAQLGQVLARPDVVAMADLILTDQLATRDDLERIARDWQGRRGAAALHWALPQIRSGPLSRPESLHRQLIMRAGIPEPELNVMVYDERGGALALADEVWPDYRVLVEYEGDHHRERGRFRADITRFERYADAGWGAARTHAHDVFGDPNPAIGRLWRRLVANGWRSRQRAPRPVFAMRA